jgi:ABC-type cobalamin/Fe3+-siderophores transport system ATPase subunit
MEKLLEIDALNILIKEKAARTASNKLILSDVNITINKGDFIFLKGNNGSGKSTFLNILARYTPPRTTYCVSGKCAYYGNGIKNKFDIFTPNVDMQWYRQQVCYIEQTRMIKENILQYFYRIMSPIKDNISKDDIKLFLYDHEITKIIGGISSDELLHKKISSFSEGQKRIIEILAGIMRSECESIKLLLIDEPFNHLDVKNTVMIVKSIYDLRKKKPEMVIISTTHCQAFSDDDNKIKSYIVADNTITPSQLPYQQGKCFKEIKLLN